MTKTLDYFYGNELAASVTASKYLLTNRAGEVIEGSPRDLHKRLAKEFARIETKYQEKNSKANALSENEIFQYLDLFRYIIPQGSPMSGIGNPYQIQSISNCFVIDSPEDSYGGICLTDQEMVQLMKRRGGVGFDISPLRPKDMPTSNAARTTDGIVTFAKRFSHSCEEVAQGGRRGALLMSLSALHPQVLDFIQVKKDLESIGGANISIRAPDSFMHAVLNDTTYTQQWPVDSDSPEISLPNVSAKAIWDEIIDAAWVCGCPGLLFWDTALKNTPSDCYTDVGFGSISTNPCGEIILSAYDSCRLIVLNTCSFVEEPFTADARFDIEKYREVARATQRLSDDLIDLELEAIERILNKVESDPEPEAIKRAERELWLKIKKTAENGRRTGAGLTALGDTVAMMGFKYGTEEALDFITMLYRELAVSSYKESCILAKERGAFSVFSHEKEKDHEFINRILDQDSELRELYNKYGRRNIANTTTAPAGSSSIVALLSYEYMLFSTSSGIEPIFRIEEHIRRRKVNQGDKLTPISYVDEKGIQWTEYKVYHSGIELWKKVTGETDVTKSPYYGASSDDLNYIDRVKLQGAAQKWICHAISSTVNLSEDATRKDIEEIYMWAWRYGCKGVTVFRDKCKLGILISKDQKKGAEAPEVNHADKRPEKLGCDIHTTIVNGEKFFVLIGLNSEKGDRPYEIFAGPVKELPELSNAETTGTIVKHKYKTVSSKYDLETESRTVTDIISRLDSPEYASFSRTISLLLRHKVPIKYVVSQLKKDKQNTLYSFAKAIARILTKYIEEGEDAGQRCLECGHKTIIFQEGCSHCTTCGWSGCG